MSAAPPRGSLVDREFFRRMRCRQSAAGEWLCHCGAVLSDLEWTECKSCDALRAEKQRAKEDADERHSAIARGLASVPRGWSWVDDPQIFAARVRSKKLRAIATKYELELGNLVLLGPAGCGKTATLYRIARRLVFAAADAGHRIRYGEKLQKIYGLHWATALSLATARARHPLGKAEAPEIDDAINAAVLCVDELGYESSRDPSMMLEILDARYVAGRITWVTSGAKPAQLVDRYGAGAWRRMVEPVGLVVEDWSAGGGQ